MERQFNKDHPDWSAAVNEEGRRIRVFRFLTDLTVQRLYQEPMTLPEAWSVVDQLRLTAERFFPGKRDVFDMVVFPRLERVIAERFPVKCPLSAEVH
jgi:hypothetical protein